MNDDYMPSKPEFVYRAIVRRVIDGDTLDVDIDMGFRAWRMRERLRLMGINTPEIRGAERVAGIAAKAYVESRLPPGTEIIIKTAPDPDAFGRWLAWVWVNGDLLNIELVAKGHAVEKTY